MLFLPSWARTLRGPSQDPHHGMDRPDAGSMVEEPMKTTRMPKGSPGAWLTATSTPSRPLALRDSTGKSRQHSKGHTVSRTWTTSRGLGGGITFTAIGYG
jgi:hypothetical protein